MSKRRRLGPLYTSYPAKNVSEYLGDKLFKLVASIICCIIWTGAYYVLLGVVNFNRKNFLEGAREMTTAELFREPVSLWILGGFFVIIFIWVFRSRIGESTKVKNGVTKLVVIGAATLLLACGCGTTETEAAKNKPKLAFSPRKSYAKLTDYKVEFSLLKHDFKAGEPATLIVGMKNVGSTPIRMEDWRIKNADNIKLFIQNWPPGAEKPVETEWITYKGDRGEVQMPAWVSVNEPIDPENDWRYPQELLPGNMVLIEKPLDFVRMVKVKQGYERRYFVKVETNLQSIEAKSGILGISVRNDVPAPAASPAATPAGARTR